MPVKPEDLVEGKVYKKYRSLFVFEGKFNKMFKFRDTLTGILELVNVLDVTKCVEEVEGVEVERKEVEAPEPDTYKPDHYYKNSFKVSDVQEEIGYNVFKALGSDDKAYKSSVWVTYALKHLCRAGNKDDVKLELKKAINYLTKALEGEFINE